MTRCAIRDHKSLSDGFDRTHIHGTHVPVEEPSTGSIPDIGTNFFGRT
jgi:hypothetical protein